jgi:hypothetical protein
LCGQSQIGDFNKLNRPKYPISAARQPLRDYSRQLEGR